MPHATAAFFEGERLQARAQGAVLVVQLFNPPHGCMDDRSESELLALLDRLDGTPALRVVLGQGEVRR